MLQEHLAAELFHSGTRTPSAKKLIRMNEEQTNLLMARCLEIYERNKSLHLVYRFLERLESVCEMLERFNDIPPAGFWEESLIPEIKKRCFPDVTIESILEGSTGLYQSIPDRALALEFV